MEENPVKKRRPKQFKKPVICEECGAEDIRRAHNQVRCSGCAEDANRKKNKNNEERKRREVGIRAIGSIVRCAGCGAEYIWENPAQKDCHDCVEARRVPRDRECKRRYETEKRETDPHFCLNQRMKCAVRRGLKEGKGARSWTSLTGYTLEQLSQHIERQFKRGMSWDNFGEWHIDHRQPLVSFSYETADDQEFKAAWCLTNLQPLWANDNLSKGGKRVLLV